MKTYKKNKNKWEYRFSTELVNGGVYDCLVIVTQYGFEFASYCYSKSLREQITEVPDAVSISVVIAPPCMIPVS